MSASMYCIVYCTYEFTHSTSNSAHESEALPGLCLLFVVVKQKQ